MKRIKYKLNKADNYSIPKDNNKITLEDEIEVVGKRGYYSDISVSVLKYPLVSLSQRHFSSITITSATTFLNIFLDNILKNNINNSLRNFENGETSNKILSNVNLNLGIGSEATSSNIVGFYFIFNFLNLFFEEFQVFVIYLISFYYLHHRSNL
jgi:hypothetical protein